MIIGEFTLSSSSLLSQYGFHEGEQLGDWLFDNCYHFDHKNGDIYLIEKDLFDFINDNDKYLLIQIVQTFLIPEIEKNHKIMIEIKQHKNPITIREIDDVEVILDESTLSLKPEKVVIIANDLLSYIRKLMKKGSE